MLLCKNQAISCVGGTRCDHTARTLLKLLLVAVENKIGKLYEFLHHEVSINDFRDFVENVLNSSLHVLIPQSVQRAKNIINTIAISSAEAERGFLLMNLIYTDKRGSLFVKKVSNLMIINLIGLLLDLWNPTFSVKTWLRKNYSADDNRVKKTT